MGFTTYNWGGGSYDYRQGVIEVISAINERLTVAGMTTIHVPAGTDDIQTGEHVSPGLIAQAAEGLAACCVWFLRNDDPNVREFYTEATLIGDAGGAATHFTDYVNPGADIQTAAGFLNVFTAAVRLLLKTAAMTGGGNVHPIGWYDDSSPDGNSGHGAVSGTPAAWTLSQADAATSYAGGGRSIFGVASYGWQISGGGGGADAVLWTGSRHANAYSLPNVYRTIKWYAAASAPTHTPPGYASPNFTFDNNGQLGAVDTYVQYDSTASGNGDNVDSATALDTGPMPNWCGTPTPDGNSEVQGFEVLMDPLAILDWTDGFDYV